MPQFAQLQRQASDFNPRNTLCIPLVKIFAFLEFEQTEAF